MPIPRPHTESEVVRVLLHNGGQPARGSKEPKGLHIRGPRPGGQIDHGRAYDPMQRPDAGPGWFSPSRRPRKEHPCDAVALVGRSPASLPLQPLKDNQVGEWSVRVSVN